MASDDLVALRAEGNEHFQKVRMRNQAGLPITGVPRLTAVSAAVASDCRAASAQRGTRALSYRRVGNLVSRAATALDWRGGLACFAAGI